MQKEPFYDARLGDALKLAADAFAHVARKGTGIPYLSHLLAVSTMVMEHGGTPDQCIAAVLHDYLEDIHGASEVHLQERFGDNVALLVRALSDTTQAEHKEPWLERKQRYIAHLPTAGEMVLYDRSWYNRAGVERVMGFCSPAEYLEFMREVPELERMLVRSGRRLYKYWFSVTRAEQERRFVERETDPLKRWKLSPIDKASLDKWDDYTEAKEAMFFYTDTADAPWTIVKSDDKKRARLNCMRHFLSTVDYPEKDWSVIGTPDPLIVGGARQVLGGAGHILDTATHPAIRR